MTPLRFLAGRIELSRSALAKLDGREIEAGLSRHLSGDWGDVDVLFGRVNDLAAAIGLTVSSRYESERGGQFWIVTLGDRSKTTVLLPEDY